MWMRWRGVRRFSRCRSLSQQTKLAEGWYASAVCRRKLGHALDILDYLKRLRKINMLQWEGSEVKENPQ